MYIVILYNHKIRDESRLPVLISVGVAIRSCSDFWFLNRIIGTLLVYVCMRLRGLYLQKQRVTLNIFFLVSLNILSISDENKQPQVVLRAHPYRWGEVKKMIIQSIKISFKPIPELVIIITIRTHVVYLHLVFKKGRVWTRLYIYKYNRYIFKGQKYYSRHGYSKY